MNDLNKSSSPRWIFSRWLEKPKRSRRSLPIAEHNSPVSSVTHLFRRRWRIATLWYPRWISRKCSHHRIYPTEHSRESNLIQTPLALLFGDRSHEVHRVYLKASAGSELRRHSTTWALLIYNSNKIVHTHKAKINKKYPPPLLSNRQE